VTGAQQGVTSAPFPLAYTPPLLEDLARLEHDVERQLRNPELKELKLLGYGEITVAVAYPTNNPLWAGKRLPPSKDAAAILRYKAHVERYIALLIADGIDVIPTTCHVVPASNGASALYLCQPILPAETLGPAVLNTRKPDPEDPLINAIFDSVIRVTSPTLAIDAQLPNWAWIGDRPWQLDVSTPFTRSADDQHELDDRLIVRPFPSLLQPVLRRFVVPSVLARYHALRPSFVDFIGNLKKEGLANWMDAATIAANAALLRSEEAHTHPITVGEAIKYAGDEAKLWTTIYQLKRLSRMLTKARGGVYQYMLSPPTAYSN
jgi:Family of unknown function (DUF6206)